MKVVPEKTYSVKEAARYLGVHRCTIYAYIRYKETGLPKRGRKRKKHR